MWILDSLLFNCRWFLHRKAYPESEVMAIQRIFRYVVFDKFEHEFWYNERDIAVLLGGYEFEGSSFLLSASLCPEMETATVLRCPFSVCRSPVISSRSPISLSRGSEFVRFTTYFRWIKQASLASRSITGIGRSMVPLNMSSVVVKASSSSDSEGSTAQFAPLQLESPVGLFLSEILVSHPHLVHAAVDQQLEQLQIDRDAEKQKEVSVSGSDLVLFRRIAEVKANERRKVCEEILYALVVQKFMDADISMIPSLTPSSPTPSRGVDTWPSQNERLEQLHSLEANEMIQDHLAHILGNRLGDSSSVALISKLRVGQVYAASVMYGYFLRRVDQRFQLEKAMKTLPKGIDGRASNPKQAAGGAEKPGVDDAGLMSSRSHPEISFSGSVRSAAIKLSRLQSYVMSLDADTLMRYATIRSNEAVSITEKHTEALFGSPQNVITPQGTVESSKDELIKIGFGGLKSSSWRP
ncbi:hypothetical protein Nepgr_025203 [Nepenthes gracilis]|uniref:Uncharacterized protein n=1 Tax=Nepenthes gracilis TaxID=150966 RepID=A0AAD3T4R9_NEPGR|nr:hypothetical protein Nepgr_025203 [Nepenthes gracilis]